VTGTLYGISGQRYEHLVRVCRDLKVATPEDPYPVGSGQDGPVAVAPLFLLHLLAAGASTKDTWYDGVRFEEVSLGYAREWRSRDEGPSRPHAALPGSQC
jgi:hypothetical protein